MSTRARFSLLASMMVCVGMLCAVTGTARSYVIVTSGSFHDAQVSGAADVLDPPTNAVQTFGDGTTASEFTSGPANQLFSGAIGLAGGNVTADSQAGFDASAQIDGIDGRSGSPIVSGGSVQLSASSIARLSTSVATGPGEWAWARVGASTLSVIDFGVVAEDAALSVNGSLLDRTLGPDNVGFTLADTTTGFVVLGQDTDVADDATPSPFSHHVLVQKDHVYRMVLSTRVRPVCASTSAPNIANCGEPASFSLHLAPDDAPVEQSAAGSISYDFATNLPEPGIGLTLAVGVASLARRRRRA